MKILHVAHNHPGFHAGGTELFAQSLSRTMAAWDGVESRFLGVALPLHRQPNPGTFFVADPTGGDDLVMAGGRFEPGQLSQVDSLGFLTDWERLLQDWQPDVVHFHHILMLGVEAVMIARRVLPKARLIMTLHDYYPICRNDGLMLTPTGELCQGASNTACLRCCPEAGAINLKLRELAVRTALDQLDALVAPSRFLAGRYRAWGLPEARLHHIPNALATLPGPLAPPPAAPDRPVRFGFFGHLNAAKGVLVLLRALALLQSRGIAGFHLGIHGSAHFAAAEVRAEIDSRVRDLGPLVSLHGAYPRQEVYSRMGQVDWVVMPSIWWENDPLVIAEAQACRRPVICSGIGGMAERVTHQMTGLHAPPGDAAGWADTLAQAIATPALAAQLADNIPPPRPMAACADAYAALYGAARCP